MPVDPVHDPPFDGPHGWIQFKGTNVCMDVHCECGAITHIDAEFCYAVICCECRREYEVNGSVKLVLVPPGKARHDPKITGSTFTDATDAS